MHFMKHVANALFVIFLCFVPLLAMAQEQVARLIDVPNVENDKSSLSMTEEIRKAITDAGHIVFTEEEMTAAAASANVSGEYWKDPEKIAKVNKISRHDAVVRVVNKNKYVVVYIYNAYTGEVMAELERRLKKRGRVRSADSKAIAKGVTQITADIVPIEYKQEIVITINSTPSGASVMRDGISIGTTPFEYKTTEAPGTSEQWVITYPEHEPASQLISLEKSFTYDVNLHAKVYEPEHLGKLGGGTGRPILMVGFNAAPTIRGLASAARKGKPIGYTSQTFPMFSFDIEFYPFPIGLDVDYLQGLGIIFNIGFGFLDSSFEITNPGKDNKCTLEGKIDGNKGTYTCETSYVRIRAGIVYKLLMQNKNNRLNPDGLALDFILAYNYSDYDIDENGLYSGHDYSGLDIGIRFSAPLGLKSFRIAANVDFLANFGQGEKRKTTKWGTGRDSSLGVTAGINFMYDIWKGLYARFGYNFTYIKNKYTGNGSVGPSRSEPVGAETEDMYHEILIGLGYLLY